MVGKRDGLRTGRDDSRRLTTKQSTRFVEALGARDVHELSRCAPRVGTSLEDNADTLVAGNQRIGEAGERWHASGKEQFLGTGANARILHGDHHIGGGRFDERQFTDSTLRRFFENNGEGMLECTVKLTVFAVSILNGMFGYLVRVR
ncbi:hypothetical protein MASR1M101_10080 [Gemmatimonas sp.]